MFDMLVDVLVEQVDLLCVSLINVVFGVLVDCLLCDLVVWYYVVLFLIGEDGLFNIVVLELFNGEVLEELVCVVGCKVVCFMVCDYEMLVELVQMVDFNCCIMVVFGLVVYLVMLVIEFMMGVGLEVVVGMVFVFEVFIIFLIFVLLDLFFGLDLWLNLFVVGGVV